MTEFEVTETKKVFKTKKDKKGATQKEEKLLVKLEAESGEKMKLELHTSGGVPSMGDFYQVKASKEQKKLKE